MVTKPLAIVVDTREQLPYDFDAARVEVVRRKLEAGDYALAGHEEHAVVERKTLDDYVSTVIHSRERFHKELQVLARARYSCVVVEGTQTDVLAGRFRGGAEPAAVMGATLSIVVDFGVPVFFCGERPSACVFTEQFLGRAARALTRKGERPIPRRRAALLHTLSPEVREAYESYELLLLKQIVKGAKEHGDASFALSDDEVEWQKLEELIDADVGWSFVPFVRRLRSLTGDQP